jgi:hypothetical protein
MKIKIDRQVFTDLSTIGQLFINDVAQCWTLELPMPLKGAARVKGKTCVPTGTYQVFLSLYKGEVLNWMKNLNPSVDNTGLPQICNINGNLYPNWIDESDGLPIAGIDKGRNVYIHIGNTAADTLGCLLVGLNVSTDRIDRSTDAFSLIYPQIVKAIQSGEQITIEYTGERSV